MKAASRTQQTMNVAESRKASELTMTIRLGSGLGRAREFGLLAENRAHDGAGVARGQIEDDARHAERRGNIAKEVAALQSLISAPGHAEQDDDDRDQPQPGEEAEQARQAGVSDDGNRQSDHADGEHGKDQLLGEPHSRRELRLLRPAGAPDLGQELARNLDEALGPAALLDTEILEPLRQLAHDVRLHEEDAGPALEMGSQHEVEILRQRVMRPAARLLHRGAPPDAAGAVELERHAA